MDRDLLQQVDQDQRGLELQQLLAQVVELQKLPVPQVQDLQPQDQAPQLARVLLLLQPQQLLQLQQLQLLHQLQTAQKFHWWVKLKQQHK